jgi:poly-gamma-glutamate synthesis protein (capsule biosynthesis protein)
MSVKQFALSIAVTSLLPCLSLAAGGAQAVPVNAPDKTVKPVVLFLSGDVMLGRAIDQILPYHADPVLYEDYIRDARDYVRLAEKTNGPIQQPVSCDYIWGDALDELAAIRPDARIINLETSITHQGRPWKNKYIHYRMHPENTACLASATIDIALLANNHVLDWGYEGLADTLFALERTGITASGAGRDLQAASRPAVIELDNGGKVIVSAWAHASSGVPAQWAATTSRPGVNRLDYLNSSEVRRIAATIETIKRPGDIAVVSIHWGGNWGYDIPQWQTAFARRLIDEAGVDVVHGHSSHHVKGIEVYKDRLIIYGSGDLLNDYEGIGGHKQYRADLSLMYFASLDPASGRLLGLRMTPTQIRRLRINRASPDDAAWLEDMLNREGQRFNTRVKLDADNRLVLEW